MQQEMLKVWLGNGSGKQCVDLRDELVPISGYVQ